MKWGVWTLALTLPVALGLAWAGLRAPVPVAAFSGAARVPCRAGLTVADGVVWRPAGQKPGSSWAGEADLYSSGLLRVQVCGPGQLTFTASGTPAAGQDATLVVALGATPLLETSVRQPRVYTLRITGPGWLSFGFPNDLNRPPQDRNLFLRGLKFMPD